MIHNMSVAAFFDLLFQIGILLAIVTFGLGFLYMYHASEGAEE
jgi:hypothetical protein